jgi:transposase
LVDRLTGTIVELSTAIEQEAHKRPEVLRLMTHPGVGPIMALAFVLTIGSPDRFACGKQIGSYLGLIPEEDSSANRQRLGHITKEGSSLVRYLLTEAARAAVRWDPTGAVATCIWPCVATGPWLRWRWPADWPSVSTGCGGSKTIINSI